MASTTTQLIQTIDPTFPISGQDNDSEGFRNNFNIIQSALLNINTATEAMQAQLTSLAGNTVNVDAPYVTGTHVVAKSDLTIGGTNVITTSGNFNTVISAGGGAGSVVLSVSTLTSYIVGAGDLSPGNSRFDYIILRSAFGILSNSKFALNGNTYTVNNLDYVGNTCTTTPSVLLTDYESVTSLTPVVFTNPFIPGQVSIDTILSQRLSGGSNLITGILTATNIVVGSTGIKFSDGTTQTTAAKVLTGAGSVANASDFTVKTGPQGKCLIQVHPSVRSAFANFGAGTIKLTIATVDVASRATYTMEYDSRLSQDSPTLPYQYSGAANSDVTVTFTYTGAGSFVSCYYSYIGT